MFKKYSCGLDIGSSKIAAAVAVLAGKKIVDIFFESQDIRGVRYGSVIDSAEVVESIGRVLKNLKAKSGVPIKAVYTNISGQDISTKHSTAIIPLAERGNKLVSTLDMEKVIDQAFVLGSTIDEEVIHQIPVGYSVDAQSGISNPLGLYAHKLAVDLYLISAKLSMIQTVTYAVHQAGYEVREVFFSGLATSDVVFDASLAHGTNILIDMGFDITEVLVFRDGVVREILLLHMGGSDLTRELAERMSVPYELAAELKISHGPVDEPLALDERKEVLVRKEGEVVAIRHKDVADILNAKTKSLCLLLKDVLEKTVPLADIRHCIFTGRTILQEGFLEMVEAHLGIPVEFARVRDPQIASAVAGNSALSGRKYLTYLTALGLICKRLEGFGPKTPDGKHPPVHPLKKAVHKLTEIYQEYF
ncbi:MAG: cell division protein FtsA [Candidatus Omnitrophica bacterium]|nr:cell division protein FtsA [Candidatus Omnitrophota bacterium]